MNIVSAPITYDFQNEQPNDLEVVLFSYADNDHRVSVGSSIKKEIIKRKLKPDKRTWDLLAISLSVIAADLSVRRNLSPDGWTRDLELIIAVDDPDFWNSQKTLLEQQLQFLTTDLWDITFRKGNLIPEIPSSPSMPLDDCVSLLSGGLDSLIGAIDLVTRDKLKPFLVSQVSKGDKSTQTLFASKIGGGLNHLQLNHNVKYKGVNERSQRARSFIFLAYGVLAATTLKRYHDGQVVKLYVCENGYISVNPPLTLGRIGSLSTRTTHPIFIGLFQNLLDACDLNVRIINPYQFATKGEMMAGCSDQSFLLRHASQATSCSRYARNKYQHCGHCIPCIVRRSAFLKWGNPDSTPYIFRDLSQNDNDHSGFDDVRATAMAVIQVREDGIESLIGNRINSTLISNTNQYREIVRRGIHEIDLFLQSLGVV